MDLGNGFQRWKTIPTRCLRATTSSAGSYTLFPSRHRTPSWRTPGIRSLSLLIDLRNVDLPQPDGPMRAVTDRGGTAIEMFLSACFFPYQKEKSRASMVPSVSGGVAGATTGAAA